MKLTVMQRILRFIQKEPVLSAAWALALLSMLLVAPDAAYLDYLDLHTLGLLFALMAVMAGLRGLGVFRLMGQAMLRRTRTTRQLELVLVFLPFFTSMAVTNDVALITFVPFALEVLTLAGLERRAISVVVMQTIAANLGSMSTPIGNPQNLYLYSRYAMTSGDFFSAVLPFSALSALLLVVWILSRRSRDVRVVAEEAPAPIDRGKVGLYLCLFLLCLGVVAKWLPLWLAVTAVLAALLAVDRPVLARVDYGLLATFVGFFVFVGNLGRLPAFCALFRRLLEGHEVLCAAGASQVISNVPAALLLSGFTGDGRALLLGTNLGGLGTLIASMASLISYKYISVACPRDKGRYLLRFTAANLLFLALLLAAWRIIE